MAPRTKIFVGRLPEGCKSEDLQALFSKYGAVAECDVINKYGFVHMKSPDEADVAIKNLHNSVYMGSTITVEQSHSKLHPEPGAPGRARGDYMDGSFGPRGPHGMGPGPFRNGFPPRSFGPRNGFGPRGFMNGGGPPPEPGYHGRYDAPPRDPYFKGGFRERPRPYPMFERRGPPMPPPSQRDDMYSHGRVDDLYSRRPPPPSYYGSGFDYDRPSDYLYSRRSPIRERPFPPPTSMRRPAAYY